MVNFNSTKKLFQKIILFNALDDSLLSRRIFPELQMVYNTLSVTRNVTGKVLTVSYRPNNCTVNIAPSGVRQVVSNVSILFKSYTSLTKKN